MEPTLTTLQRADYGMFFYLVDNEIEHTLINEVKSRQCGVSGWNKRALHFDIHLKIDKSMECTSERVYANFGRLN